MALDADAAWPLKWEVSFLLIQAEHASWRQSSKVLFIPIAATKRVGLIQALGAAPASVATSNAM